MVSPVWYFISSQFLFCKKTLSAGVINLSGHCPLIVYFFPTHLKAIVELGLYDGHLGLKTKFYIKNNIYFPLPSTTCSWMYLGSVLEGEQMYRPDSVLKTLHEVAVVSSSRYQWLTTTTTGALCWRGSRCNEPTQS